MKGLTEKIPMSNNAGEKEVVQYHHTGVLLQKRKHVAMERGIAEVIQHSIKLACMLAEPSHIPHRAVSKHPRISHFVLGDNDLDLVMARQLRQ